MDRPFDVINRQNSTGASSKLRIYTFGSLQVVRGD